ncbi:MAG: gas vesicle protein [Actinobacteria bacterium]|nr:gas vesicle protein [Actinomycetota bacterium]
MAERRGTRRRDDEEREPDESREERESRSGQSAADGVTAPEAAQAALRAIVDLTGKHPEGVTAVEPTEDGWLVGVEVVEDQRIPSSSDILAIYEAELDLDGSLMSYRRGRRYPRGRGDSGGDR